MKENEMDREYPVNSKRSIRVQMKWTKEQRKQLKQTEKTFSFPAAAVSERLHPG
jgi:hypothetical protein